MASPLLLLPYELRIYIYELVLCTHGTAQLVSSGPRESRRSFQSSFLYGDERECSQPLAGHYPPEQSITTEYTAGEAAADPEPAPELSDFDHLLVETRDPTLGTDEPENDTIEDYGIRFVDGRCELHDYDSDADDNSDAGQTSNHAHSATASDYANAPASYLHRFGYDLRASKPLDVALLRACRSINIDATPIFYSGINFVFETDPIKAMRFLKTFPESALCKITTVTLPPTMLDPEHPLCEAAWSADLAQTLNTSPGPVMYTPFGAFLAVEMPSLTDIYAYRSTNYRLSMRWAFTELERLLCHRRIQRLHYISMGEDAAKRVRSGLPSNDLMKDLTGTPGSATASDEFERRYPVPELLSGSDSDSEEIEATSLSEREEWIRRFNEYKRRHAELFGWRWGDRDIEMAKGTVQAVVTAWLK